MHEAKGLEGGGKASDLGAMEPESEVGSSRSPSPSHLGL